MLRALLLGGTAVCVFVVVAAILVKVMPGPLKSSDYMVIGSVATLVALLVMFLAVASTTLKSKNVFFKRRRNDVVAGPKTRAPRQRAGRSFDVPRNLLDLLRSWGRSFPASAPSRFRRRPPSARIRRTCFRGPCSIRTRRPSRRPRRSGTARRCAAGAPRTRRPGTIPGPRAPPGERITDSGPNP